MLGGICLSMAQPTLVRWEAAAASRIVLQGNPVEVFFTLFNAEAEDFKAPAMNGFKVLSGPEKRQGASLQQGIPQRELSYVYRLQPLKTGVSIIGAAGVRTGGRWLYTQPLSIELVSAPTEKPSEAWLETRPSERQTWVGAQVVTDFAAYLRNPQWSVQVRKAPDYAGMRAVAWEEKLPDRTEQVQGAPYLVRTERVSLYPQKSGRLLIGPMQAEALEWQRDSATGLGHHTRRAELTSKPVSIDVKPLPPGAPRSFCGGVGHFDMEASCAPLQGTAQEAFVLTLHITGTGDMARVEAPALELPSGLKAWPPELAEERMLPSYRQQTFLKTFRYALTAADTGRYAFRIAMSWFDPDSAAYRTILSEPFALTVTPGAGGTVDAAAMDALQPQKPAPDPARRKPVGLAIAAGVLLILALWYAGHFFGGHGAEIFEQTPDAAHQEYLAQAAAHLQAGAAEPFYQAITLAIYTFLQERYGLMPADWSKENAIKTLTAQGIEASVTAQIDDILHTAETALYAQADQEAQAPAVYRQTAALLEQWPQNTTV